MTPLRNSLTIPVKKNSPKKYYELFHYNQAELEELRANLEEKSAKLKNVEKEKRDLANASRQMEATVAKLNSDIFNAKE